MLVLRCEDSTDGILSAVYDAWEARAGHSNTKIELISDEYCYNEELFAELNTVQKALFCFFRIISSKCTYIFCILVG